MKKLVRILALGAMLLSPSSAFAFTFENTLDAITNGEDLFTGFGDLHFPGNFVTDGLVRLEPLIPLPQTVTVGLWPQHALPTPTLTSDPGYTVFTARDVSIHEEDFGGPVRLRYSYSEGGLPCAEAALRLFSFSLATGRWAEVPAVLDSGANQMTAVLQGPGLFGLGAPAVLPAFPTPGLVALAVVLATVALWAMRRRAAGAALAAGLVAAALVGRAAFTSAPEVTNPGNKAINHTEKDGAVTKAAATYRGKACTGMSAKYIVWQYKGAGDPTNAANWNKVPKTVDMLKEGHPDEKGVADDPGIAGAATDGAYDNDTDPFYDCAGYALRSSGYIPLDPNTDGKVIIDNEYSKVGAATGTGNRVGDIVTYKKDGKITHYGVVDEVDGDGKIKKVKSKWGRGRKMKHDLGSVPAPYGDADQVYRKT
jgi:hypothetical protein